jgi:hypothetical protein
MGPTQWFNRTSYKNKCAINLNSLINFFIYHMNNLNNNIINILCKLLDIGPSGIYPNDAYYPQKDTNALRLCSKYYNKLITPKHFFHAIMNTKKIYKNKEQFRHFINKYKLEFSINTIDTFSQLAYFHSYNIAHIYEFSKILNKPYSEYLIPATLKYLVFDNTFNKQLNTLPSKLEYLILGNKFNQPIKQLPPTLKFILFKNNFNQPIHKLPASLNTLIFGCDFNQPIAEHVFPPTLTRLSFNTNFNQPIEENILPASLIELTFSGIFNHSFKKNVLPLLLKSLILGDHYNQPIEPAVLPASLEELCFGNAFNQPIEEHTLPLSLLTLEFSNNFNQLIKKNILPPLLQTLTLPHYYKQSIDSACLFTNFYIELGGYKIVFRKK